MKITWLILGAGLLLLFWCMDQVAASDRTLHRICVAGKLFSVTLLLWISKNPYVALLYELCFFPKPKEQKTTVFGYCLPAALGMAGAAVILCVSENHENRIRTGMLVFFLLLLMVTAEFVVDLLMKKNRELSAQVKQNAVGELRMKNLNRELTIQSHSAEHDARLEERETIARNIHNVVGHTITSAIVSLQAYEVLAEVQPERAKEKLNTTSERMHLALEEIRRVVRVMDADTEEISIVDFARILKDELVQFVTDTELQATHNLDGYGEETQEFQKQLWVEKKNAEFLHSVLTECLNNGVRHGGATAFMVQLIHDHEHIQLVVQDNGCGFDGKNETEQKICLENGFGLRKIMDYVRKNGGSAEYSGEAGFRVQVTLPLIAGSSENNEK